MSGMSAHSRRWILTLTICLVAAGPALGQDASENSADWETAPSALDAVIGQSSGSGEISPVRRVPPMPLRPLYSEGPIPLQAVQTAPAPQADEFCCDEIHFLPTLGEVGILLVVPWFFNRHVSDDSTATMSFDAWKRNVVQGMEWDADSFNTNMWAHPYHGAMYFNAARGNGYNFWQSAAWSWSGSFLWETFGENNRPAINDWAATAIGGQPLVLGALLVGQPLQPIHPELLLVQRRRHLRGIERGGRRQWAARGGHRSARPLRHRPSALGGATWD